MRITYVIDSLASKGGAERIIINKMSYLAEEFGYDISVITCYQSSDTSNAYLLSSKVKQVYLGISFYSQYNYHYPYRLWVKRNINQQLQRMLPEAIELLEPDILIGVGYVLADIVSKQNCKAKKIIEAHEPRPFTLSNYGLSRNILSRIYMRNARNRYFRTVEKNADVVVTLTKGDAHEWRKAKRTIVIPNFTVMPISSYSTCKAKRVIAVGRLEWVKGFDRLIEIWSIVTMKHPDWHLDIFGSGTMEPNLKKMIKDKNLRTVTIHPFTPDIAQEYSQSSILAATSHFEGFSLAIIEAMHTGVPCISFDCPFGPKDVIEDGVSGYIIDDNNISLFAKRMCDLMENFDKRIAFSKASIEIIKQFDVETIMNTWKKLFEELTR